jgi:hypothetical protein
MPKCPPKNNNLKNEEKLKIPDHKGNAKIMK